MRYFISYATDVLYSLNKKGVVRMFTDGKWHRAALTTATNLTSNAKHYTELK